MKPATLTLLGAVAICAAGCTTDTAPVVVLPNSADILAALQGIDQNRVRGDRLLASGNPALAYDAYIRSIAQSGPTAEALTGAGVAAAQRGLLGQARQRFENALDLAPGSAVAHNNLGTVLHALGQYGPARAHFAAAIALSKANGGLPVHNLALAETALAAIGDQQAAQTRPDARLERLGVRHYRLLEEPRLRSQGQER